MSQQSPVTDALTIGPRVIPPSGQLGNERFRVVLPPSASFGTDMIGRLVPIPNPDQTATLTISCLQGDEATAQLLALLNEQTAAARAGTAKPAWPGNGRVKVSDVGMTVIAFSDAWVEQQGDVVSSGALVVTTWTLRLQGVTRA